MASIINASSSGSGGIVQTADASGVLQLQANGTVAFTVNSNASLTVSNTGSGITFSSSAGSGIRVYGAAGTNQWDVYGNGANLRFSDNTGGGRIVIDGTASVGTTFGVGGATPAASGAGVTFPATQSASSDANTLDDYEEGTWTPTVTTGAVSYGFQIGRYVKIGKTVTITCSVNVSSRTASGSTFSLDGLPFASESTSSNYVAVPTFPILGFNRSTATSYVGQIAPGTSRVTFYGVITSTGNNFLTMTMNDTGSIIEVEFSVTYIAN